MNFSHKLLNWYAQNKRDLPWRNTQNPYFIWLSEVILQQTRVQQGLSYYLKFIEAFPTVSDLANAPQDQVLKLWEGLGYYSRARNLHATAQVIQSEYNGYFPTTYKELIQLKGIGPYTAAAIASIAFNEVQAVVDGNVYRVLSRVFDVETFIDSTTGKKEFQALANELISNEHPAEFNQAIMEFGATHCTPKQPNCSTCIFNDSCAALEQNKIELLPRKEKKTKKKNRYFNYLVLHNTNKHTFIQQRTESDIWQGLYQFPLIESNEPWVEFNPTAWPLTTIQLIHRIEAKKHVLSHQNLYCVFWVVKGAIPSEKLPENWQQTTFDELENFAFPVIIKNHLEQLYWAVQ